MTRKTRNTGYGSARWLGDEWVDAIVKGEPASQTASKELAREVKHYRRRRSMLVDDVRDFGEVLEKRHGPRAAALLRVVAVGLLTPEELYGDAPSKPAVAGIDRKALLRIVAGESATTAEVDALADEVLVRRAATANAVASLLNVATAHPDAAEAIRAALVSLAPIDEIYPCPPKAKVE